MTERLRFSPAPTGSLHVGGARTALFNYLVARRAGGEFLVRVEDTDASRVVPGAERSILDDLEWLGIVPDESPLGGGPYGPYRQSERGGMYVSALDILRAGGSAYPCFCTSAQLAADRRADAEAGRPPRYAGRCRSLDPRSVAERIASGAPHTWRFAVPLDAGEVVVEDIIRGDVGFDAEDMGDFVLVRSDGTATYDLANVVDDHEMAVTTVVRGDDHLANTARHMLLYRAFGWHVPRFAHVPLVLGSDGAPLSKSAGGSTVRELRDAGIPAGALVGYLATMGWAPSEECEPTDITALAACFDLAAVSASPAHHDLERLKAMSGRVLRAWEPTRLAAAFGEFASLPSWLDAVRFASAIRDQLSTLADVEPILATLVSPDPDAEARAILATPDAGRSLAMATAIGADSVSGEAFSDRFKAELRAEGVGVRTGMMAVRAALLGRVHGMPVADLVDLLGRERTTRRLNGAAGLR